MEFAAMTERQQIRYVMQLSASEQLGAPEPVTDALAEATNAPSAKVPKAKMKKGKKTNADNDKENHDPAGGGPSAKDAAAGGNRAKKDAAGSRAKKDPTTSGNRAKGGAKKTVVADRAVALSNEGSSDAPAGDIRACGEAGAAAAPFSAARAPATRALAADEDGAASPPRCWFDQRDVPDVGAVLAVHAHPQNDAARPARWYRASVVKVLSRQRKGRVKVVYDVDATFDVIEWPPAGGTARAVGGDFGAGRCAFSGAVEAVLPAQDDVAAGVGGGAAAGVAIVPCASRFQDEDCERLWAYKAIADDVLPAMRGRNCLYNATFARASTTLVAVVDDAGWGHDAEDVDARRAAAQRDVVGGCTFRLFRAGECLVCEVLIICVAQRPAVCGRGSATRLVNAVKRCAVREAKARGLADCHVIAAAEHMPQAEAFWAKQRLVAGAVADHAFEHLRRSGSAMEYNNTTHVSMDLGTNDFEVPADFVSERAQVRHLEAKAKDAAAAAALCAQLSTKLRITDARPAR
ncbi:hypothetical protein M885DRAFT_623006 [Pelagophyceae sp. CCMP2097]|nr:hypothetical protein M885DRAFT_623006 [Pelagophyceae sp. CCMP2097]